MLDVATAPVNWNNADLPDWRPHVPFPRILDRMREAGFTATEYDPAFGDDPETLLAAAKARSMTWVGCFQWVDLQQPALDDTTLTGLDRLCQVLRDLECTNLIVADRLRPERVAIAGRVPGDGSASLTDDGYDRIAANLHLLARRAGESGVNVRYHNHVGTYIETPAELEALMRRMDFGLTDLCFDTGHYAYGGGSALHFLRQYPHAAGYLHLKDVDGAVLAEARAAGWSFLEALRHIVFAPLGDGSANINDVLNTLIANDFGGWAVVEQDTCAGDPTATARANREYIERQVGEA